MYFCVQTHSVILSSVSFCFLVARYTALAKHLATPVFQLLLGLSFCSLCEDYNNVAPFA